MMDVNRMHTDPVNLPRSRRNDPIQVLTSAPAGKVVPVFATHLFREDSYNARLSVAVEMMETHELLVNPVRMKVSAWLVPFLALDRFEGSRDQFDRSYMGEPKVEGGAVVPFIETHAMGTHGSKAVYKALGLHAKPADTVNTPYLESYNQVWNHRAKNRSQHITPRTRLDDTLAPAFWMNSQFELVVPDFDQAVIDGEIALNVVTGNLPLKAAGGLTYKGVTFQQNGAASVVKTTAGVAVTSATGALQGSSSGNLQQTTGGTNYALDNSGQLRLDLTGMYAEMLAGGATISLSNLELAKKTQAFAKIRADYEGIDEDWIIDMLMDGLSIPDQSLKQPIQLAQQIVPIQQAKRYATDGDNLAESAVSGGAVANLAIRVPRISTGGIVMVFVECVPDQLYERRADPFFHSANNTAWPEQLRDYLDPEKVDRVTNREIDTDHATPASTFGYAPMNWKWNGKGPKVGGKFYRPTVNTLTDAERRRIWAIEPVNPALSADFYVVNAVHLKGFLNELTDPFEVAAVGNGVMEGNTIFGGMLVEATGNYDAVLAKAPQERLAK